MVQSWCYYYGASASAPVHKLVVKKLPLVQWACACTVLIVLIAHAPYSTVSSRIFPQQFVTRLVLVRVCNRILRLVNQSIYMQVVFLCGGFSYAEYFRILSCPTFRMCKFVNCLCCPRFFQNGQFFFIVQGSVKYVSQQAKRYACTLYKVNVHNVKF